MKLIYQNTEIGHWYDLILMAQEDAAIQLEHELEGYVVMMLMRFNRTKSLSDAVLALEFLEALDEKNNKNHDQMREVADKCLIYSGLFPERTKRKRVDEHYFIQLGQSAYRILCDAISHGMPLLSRLYEKLSSEFIAIVDVIGAMRMKKTLPISRESFQMDEKQADMLLNYRQNAFKK
ncbi:MAG: hypothetical protein EP298_02935 [Gammaproteobacteria bacterium]|nr:MAG: hypothetical protein EP298_02935 [Gammaproteobacteria bacterium]UTW43361.1 hypothetical protein KFE69_04500 [bacterium SCSIO 12844]